MYRRSFLWTTLKGISGTVLVWSRMAVLAGAQLAHPTPTAVTPPRFPAPPEAVKVPLIARVLSLNDFRSGKDGMQPSSAASLAHFTQFVQSSPRDGAAPTEQTEVWAGRTQSLVQFVFVCHDAHPELIRSHLARRENILKDDSVSVLLDPLEDHRRGVLFTVNPAGVQADGNWTENEEPDYSYDQVWSSTARVTPSGWIAIISIPFRSVRFRVNKPSWGIVLRRGLPRNSEVDYWPRVASNVSGVLTQEAEIAGFGDKTDRGHNFEVTPYVLGQNVHTLNTLDAGHPYFSRRGLEGTEGGEAKLIVKDSVVFDLTINPDFSQVESDEPQFTVNQRFPVFFPELRPFFLENASYFDTLITLVYTRNIVHPEYGGRVTGRLGHTNFGVLAIDDRAPGEAYTQGDPLYGKHATFAVGRISQDFGKGSSIGLTYTDREFQGSWNRVGGPDFTLRFNDHWTASGQMAVSSTQKLATTPGTGPSTPLGAYSAGPASKLNVFRNGRSFTLENVFRDFSPGFLTETGIIQTPGLRSNNININYQWYPKKSRLLSYGIETQNKVAFDHFGNRGFHYSQVDFFVALPRNTIVAPVVGENSDTLTPAQYPVLLKNRNLTENYIGVISKSAPVPQVNWNIYYTYGGNPNYNPAVAAAPSLLHEDFVQALVTLQPIRQLTLDNTYLLDRNRSATTGDFVFENQTLRTKINYQFTAALSARVIVEYDSVLANPAFTYLPRTKQVGTQALLTWLPHPGTAIYVGYNNDLQNLNRGLCNRLPTGECDGNDTTSLPRSPDYLNDGRQFFVKASYLFRF